MAAVTPDALAKTHFVLVDAVGRLSHGYESDRWRHATNKTLQSLLDSCGLLTLNETTASQLLKRLLRLETQLTAAETAHVGSLAGRPLRDLLSQIGHDSDSDRLVELRRDTPDGERAVRQAIIDAFAPLAANSELRNALKNHRRIKDLYIDELTNDEVIRLEGGITAKDARAVVEDWEQNLKDHADEITAIQLVSEHRGGDVRFEHLAATAGTHRRSTETMDPTGYLGCLSAVGVNAPQEHLPRHH